MILLTLDSLHALDARTKLHSVLFLLIIILQDLPTGSWFCSNCTCWICGDLVNDKEASSSFDALKCSQCEHKCNISVPHFWFDYFA